MVMHVLNSNAPAFRNDAPETTTTTTNTRHSRHEKNFMHSNAIDKTKLKTKMCRNWLTGSRCPYGERCAYAHGEEDRADTQSKQQQQQQQQHGSAPIPMTQTNKEHAGHGSRPTPASQSVPQGSSWAGGYAPSLTRQTSGFESNQTTPFTPALEADSYSTNGSFLDQSTSIAGGHAGSMSGSMYDAAPLSGSFNSSFYRYEPYSGTQVTQVPVFTESDLAQQSTAERSNSSCESAEPGSPSPTAKPKRGHAVKITAPLRVPSPPADPEEEDGAHSPMSTENVTSEDATSNTTDEN
eukprot:TRINITY_DN3749_c0_g2_i1.p2 TRINITY_DN3749_c0_g2~~TRINITY_DN3749_c0_g2_i1.p2  ORF type:complete len:295 (+),score=102.34 TRINITY_DN3749_c0_g2_i1:147-1031(+)